MRPPIIVVTGAVASGKSMVARILAGRGGTVVDCDALAHKALEIDELKESLVVTFGSHILTKSGKVSRLKLGRTVFSEDRRIKLLNRVMRPFVKRIVNERIRELQSEARYIVLDAVLFFQYKFRFKVDLVVLTEAPEVTRLRRLMLRDGMSRREAEMRVDRQRTLHGAWESADLRIRTDKSRRMVAGEAAAIRDHFLEEHNLIRRE